MASFDEHINQAKRNLRFLESVNTNIPNSWDWQVTTSFYVAVHLINAHIAKKANLHYNSHNQVDLAINPNSLTSVCRLPENAYLAYKKLSGLSRRARYLCHDKPNSSKGRESETFATYDKHLSKSVRHLSILLKMMANVYSVEIDPIGISCAELKGEKFNFFKVA